MSLECSLQGRNARNSLDGTQSELLEAPSNSELDNKDIEEITEERSFPPSCSGTPHNEYAYAIDKFYSSERDLAKLYHCADMRELGYETAVSVMGEHLTTLVDSVHRSKTKGWEAPDDLINSAVKLVCGVGHPNLSLLRTFAAEDIRKWLLLEEYEGAAVGLPEDVACTALCGQLSTNMLFELKECAEDCFAELQSRLGYQVALQEKYNGYLKQMPTYRRFLEQRALRPHMQCIEVVVGPDALTVCKKIATLEDVRRAEEVLKGIVLAEDCASCQLVLQLALGRGAVITPPVTEPRHIAAYLVLALQYPGGKLTWLFDQWHRALTGQPLPLGIAPDEWIFCPACPERREGEVREGEGGRRQLGGMRDSRGTGRRRRQHECVGGRSTGQLELGGRREFGLTQPQCGQPGS
jgi:hypothetical protein